MWQINIFYSADLHVLKSHAISYDLVFSFISIDDLFFRVRKAVHCVDQ